MSGELQLDLALCSELGAQLLDSLVLLLHQARLHLDSGGKAVEALLGQASVRSSSSSGCDWRQYEFRIDGVDVVVCGQLVKEALHVRILAVGWLGALLGMALHDDIVAQDVADTAIWIETTPHLSQQVVAVTQATLVLLDEQTTVLPLLVSGLRALIGGSDRSGYTRALRQAKLAHSGFVKLFAGAVARVLP